MPMVDVFKPGRPSKRKAQIPDVDTLPCSAGGSHVLVNDSDGATSCSGCGKTWVALDRMVRDGTHPESSPTDPAVAKLCITCEKPLLPQYTWRNASAEQRKAWLTEGLGYAKGEQCSTCYHRRWKAA